MNPELICNAQISSILKTVLERCQKESDQSSLQNAIENVVERASYYTGFPRGTMSQIFNEHKQTQTSQLPKYDVPERLLITDALWMYYSEGKYPKYYDIYTALSDQLQSKDYIHFKNEMTDLGFCYTPTIKSWLLVENPELRFDRYNYLKRIKKFRSENRKIVYLGVKIIGDSCEKLENCTEKKLPIEQGVLFFAVSEQGIENFLFTNVISNDIFRKWVFDVGSQSIPKDTVIVIENNCMLGNFIDTFLTRYNSKTEMLNWLNVNNIPCSENMHKSELYELYEKAPKKSKAYVIDKLLQTNGYEVLHIPYRCNKLSLTSLLWDKLNKSESYYSSSGMAKRHFIVRDLENICKIGTMECQKQIINWEIKMLSLDLQLEQHLDDRYTFNVSQEISF